MSQFIKVTAEKCNQEGVGLNNSTPVEMHLNISVITAIINKAAIIGSSKAVRLRDSYYMNFKIQDLDSVLSWYTIECDTIDLA